MRNPVLPRQGNCMRKRVSHSRTSTLIGLIVHCFSFNAVKLPSKDQACCDKYACGNITLEQHCLEDWWRISCLVPEPTAGPKCDEPQKLLCAQDQILKLDTKPNGCQTFICECKPREECEEVTINATEALEPGYEKEIDVNGKRNWNRHLVVETRLL